MVSDLPSDLPAAVLIVQHISSSSFGFLGTILQRHTSLPVTTVRHDMAFQIGQVYVAPPGRHMLVEDGRLVLSSGPKVNRSRPAIDPLFFSAAVHYRQCVVGVILTGLLDNGAAGLAAVKRCGGVAVVQQPDDALWRGMPDSALEAVEADFVVPLCEMGATIARTVNAAPVDVGNVPDDVRREAALLGKPFATAEQGSLGELVELGCPTCGGPMHEVQSIGPNQYRCHVGHWFAAKELLDAQRNAVEESLWVALRTLRERQAAQARLAEKEERAGRMRLAKRLRARARDSGTHLQRLQELLMEMGKEKPDRYEE
jgi:two-component system chemotaxis response regulator CheB